ncbi:MAG: 3'-5' exonuclease [Saprospiraceae bacterium]|nr:3'-5' exonuclease [Saprospiraceae bacterium]
MEFNLEKDLCFFDIEATGLHVIRERIIQIAIKKFFADGRPAAIYNQLINPGIPISQEAMDITGITPAMLRNKPTFQQVAKEIYAFFGNADLAGYNSNRFDIPMLMEEFDRSGFEFSLEGRRTIDVQRIFYRMEPRTLKAAHRFYVGAEMGNSHDAMNDVEATVAVLKGQLERYEGQDLVDDEEFIEAPVKNDMRALHEFSNDPSMLDVTQRLKYNANGVIVFNFGKNQGRPVKEVFSEDQDYYHWIIKKEFSVQVKSIVKKIYQELEESLSNDEQ